MWVNGREVRFGGVTNTLDEKSVWTELDESVSTYYEGVE